MARGAISSSSEKAAVSLSKPTVDEESKQKKTNNNAILTSSKGRVDKALVERAVQALLKYHDDKQQAADGSNKNQLLGNDCDLQVQFRLLVGPQRPSVKPIAIALPHAICKMVSGGDKQENDHNDDNDDDDGLDEAEVCFIVKEDAKAYVQEMIAAFPQYMGNVKKVLGLESLRKKHASPTQRRALAARFTLFLCDDRILPMMTKALGKEFCNKKMPIPVDMRRKQAIPLAIYKSLRSTFMHLRDTATCISIVAGTTGMRRPYTKLVDNVMAICELAVLKMPRQWANVQSIALTTPECTHGLPIYNKIPAELEEISLMAGLEPIWKKSLVENNDGDDTEKKQEGQRKKRKELAAKSPLVRALKQQKKMETRQVKAAENVNQAEETTKAPSTDDKEPPPGSASSKTNKKKNKSSHENIDEKNPKETATPKSEATTEHAEKKTNSTKSNNKKKDTEAVVTKSSTTKRSKSAADNNINNNKAITESVYTDVATPQKTTRLQGEEDESKSSKKKNKKEKKEENPSSSSSSKKKRKNSFDKDNNDNDDKTEASPEKKSRISTSGGDKTETSFTKPFHAAQKFTSSKKGYVFRTGSQGLGYYVDVKPVVDKLAIAALLRNMGTAKQQQHGSGGKRSSSLSSGKNKRRSGGGGGGGSGGRRR